MISSDVADAVPPLAKIREDWYAALCALAETLTDEQRPAYDALDALWGEYLCAQQDHLVAVLAVHFPGFAPAIKAIAYHADDDTDGTGVADCCLPPSPKEWAERFVHQYTGELARLDAEFEQVLVGLEPDERQKVYDLLELLLDEQWVNGSRPAQQAGHHGVSSSSLARRSRIVSRMKAAASSLPKQALRTVRASSTSSG